MYISTCQYRHRVKREVSMKQILQHGVSYMALYWSDTEPIPSSLGPFNRYCLRMKQFVGFKDHVQVCIINGVALAAIVNPPVRSTRNTP